MPIVTVVMAAYNAEAYIDEALSSICDQTYGNVEVIVVDDGSSDATVARAQSYADRLDLSVLVQANAGPSAARNAGIRLARGRYCAFLDADDLMRPELLAAQAAVLDGHPRVGLVLTDVSTFDERGTIRERRWHNGPLAAAELLERLVVENFVTTSAVMARTDCLLDAGLFPEHRRVAEDYELWLRIAARWQLAFIDRPLVRYRYAPGSLSSRKLNSARCALDVVETFWREHPAIARAMPSAHRRSLAQHLANAGAAAILEEQRAAALQYLAGSLRYRPIKIRTWKSVAKALLGMRPGTAPAAPPRVGTAAPPGATR